MRERPGSREIGRGDLYWVEPDGSRGSVPGSPHPHLVVQDDVLNRSRIHSVVVCALTSNLKRAREPGNVLLDPGEGNLPSQSVIVVSQVSAIDKTQLGRHIGTLAPRRVDQALAGLRFQVRATLPGLARGARTRKLARLTDASPESERRDSAMPALELSGCGCRTSRCR